MFGYARQLTYACNKGVHPADLRIAAKRWGQYGTVNYVRRA